MSLQDKATEGKVGRLLKVFLFSCRNLEKKWALPAGKIVDPDTIFIRSGKIWSKKGNLLFRTQQYL